MKKVMLAFLLVATIGAESAYAAPLSFGLMGGMSVPTGDTGDFFRAGYQGGVYGDYWATPSIAIGVDAVGNFLSARDAIFDATNAAAQQAILILLIGQSYGISSIGSDLKNTASLMQFGVHAKYQMSNEGSKVKPFAQVGFGFYNLRSRLKGSVEVTGTTPPPSPAPFANSFSFDDDTSENKLGVNVGGGLMFVTSPAVGVGIGGSFHDVFTGEGATQLFNVGLVLMFSTSSK